MRNYENDPDYGDYLYECRKDEKLDEAFQREMMKTDEEIEEEDKQLCLDLKITP